MLVVCYNIPILNEQKERWLEPPLTEQEHFNFHLAQSNIF